jgi:hypothetical protein
VLRELHKRQKAVIEKYNEQFNLLKELHVELKEQVDKKVNPNGNSNTDET